ncbi:MAG: gamma-glutamyl-gamma-aminobutyrate hydrolase family protein [Actinomycetales bacterium]|nr:gamma-glutamyl-gamma-aminobutyrate hydrolase family protein [Actinomycetales bacterium]
MSRPVIAVPGRFTESASALRYRGVVAARKLLEAVWAAGGDPHVLLPADGADAFDWASRLRGVDGVLLPGGGDVNPRRYGGDSTHVSLYDVDELQDETDFTLARYALEHGVPTLAVCRGLHVVNALLGGTLVIDMDVHHRHHVHEVSVDDPADVLGVGNRPITCSCYHHQAIDQVAEGISVLGRAEDGVVEAVSIESAGWAAGIQWHPEDTYDVDPDQLLPFRKLVAEASR